MRKCFTHRKSEFRNSLKRKISKNRFKPITLRYKNCLESQTLYLELFIRNIIYYFSKWLCMYTCLKACMHRLEAEWRVTSFISHSNLPITIQRGSSLKFIINRLSFIGISMINHHSVSHRKYSSVCLAQIKPNAVLIFVSPKIKIIF